jgi:tRNA dimethylallyltransferase
LKNTLIILTGPTGAGKTIISLRLAQHLNAPIISADSRQLYKDLQIGTAAPSPQQLAMAQHYMIGSLKLDEYYSAAMFEADVSTLLNKLFLTAGSVILCGGSMMYVDAVCKGIDDIPNISNEVRSALATQYARQGLQPILDELRQLDPQFYAKVDRQNYRRVIHAVEVCRQTQKPYSSFLTLSAKPRPFSIVKIGITFDREILYQRINSRVDAMMADGLLREAQRVYPHRHLNSLNTVGYKELFAFFDGKCSLEEAVEKIKRNTRVYARKQMTWLKRDPEIKWFNPPCENDIIQYLDSRPTATAAAP